MRIEVPGKVFLLGEYAVLEGVPAVVGAIEPMFEWNSEPQFDGRTSSAFLPSAESPAGRLAQIAQTAHGFFRDPYEGTGGFGASAAEFLIACTLSENSCLNSIGQLLGRYHEVCLPQKPSGVDLITQWAGGVILFDPSLKCFDQVPIEKTQVLSFHIYSTTFFEPSRKLKTHEHLASLKNQELFTMTERQNLSQLVQQGWNALHDSNAQSLGNCLNDYADFLNSKNLEADFITQMRKRFCSISGVWGVKGSGAMQSDILVVLRDSNFTVEQQKELDQVANDFCLKEVATGFTEKRWSKK